MYQWSITRKKTHVHIRITYYTNLANNVLVIMIIDVEFFISIKNQGHQYDKDTSMKISTKQIEKNAATLT